MFPANGSMDDLAKCVVGQARLRRQVSGFRQLWRCTPGAHPMFIFGRSNDHWLPGAKACQKKQPCKQGDRIKRSTILHKRTFFRPGWIRETNAFNLMVLLARACPAAARVTRPCSNVDCKVPAILVGWAQHQFAMANAHAIGAMGSKLFLIIGAEMDRYLFITSFSLLRTCKATDYLYWYSLTRQIPKWPGSMRTWRP